MPQPREPVVFLFSEKLCCVFTVITAIRGKRQRPGWVFLPVYRGFGSGCWLVFKSQSQLPGHPVAVLRCPMSALTLPFFSLPEIRAFGSRLRVRAADARRADPAGPEAEGHDQQEGRAGAGAGGLHRQPAGPRHGGNPQHPARLDVRQQESREDVGALGTLVEQRAESPPVEVD